MGGSCGKPKAREYTAVHREYRKLFDDFDHDQDGLMTRDELKAAFQRFGLEPSDPEVDAMFSAVDVTKRGQITAEEFVKALQNNPSISSLEKAFSIFDLDGNGSITVIELRKCMLELGQRLNVRETENMFASIDLNADNKISFEEFAMMMSQHRVLDLRQVFRQFDLNADGFVNKADLEYAFKSVGVKASAVDINNIFSVADKDRDGKLSYDEFVDFLESVEN